MVYQVKVNLHHNGQVYPEGTTVELSKKEAKDLLAAGAIAKLTAEDALPEGGGIETEEDEVSLEDIIKTNHAMKDEIDFLKLENEELKEKLQKYEGASPESEVQSSESEAEIEKSEGDVKSDDEKSGKELDA